MEEIKEYWNYEFIHYEKDDLKKYRFREDTIDFLSTVGLMTGERFKKQSFKFFRFLTEFQEEEIDNEKYIRVAHTNLGSEGLYIKKGDDHVYYVDLLNKYHRKKFCNTKIRDYVKFETIKSMIDSKYPKAADDELEGYECAREVIEKFKKVDPAAVFPYSYWANRMLNYAKDYFHDEDEKFEIAIKSGKYSSDEEAYFDVLFSGMEVLKANPS